MIQDYFVVFMKYPGRPLKIRADTFREFMDELARVVEVNGPFELIYRG